MGLVAIIVDPIRLKFGNSIFISKKIGQVPKT